MEAERVLRHGVADIIVREELVERLEEGKLLRLKQGFDPTRPDIHLGHAVGLRKLRQFQDLGHQVVLIVGDWTAQIGDPSGRTVTRTRLTAEEVKQNAQTYMEQFFKIVDKEKTEVRLQSEWYSKFGLADVIELTSRFTVAQVLAREDFATRHSTGNPIAVAELLYPLMQAYDSVMIHADVEFGGTEQLFNCLVGRELQAMVGQRPQDILLVPILVGTDGITKMSKSAGNYIGISEPPDQMYGKVMSLPDQVMLNYFELLTDVSDQELAEFQAQLSNPSFNPKVLKQRLAREIVQQFHGLEAARLAEEEFARIFEKRELPSEIPVHHLPAEWFDKAVFPADLLLETKVAQSRAEARRLVAQGGVRLDGVRLLDEAARLKPEGILQVGRRRFIRLRPAK